MPLKLGGQLLLCTLILLAGCGRVSVIEAPQAEARATPEGPHAYDLAVTSVDFDPALQGNKLALSPQYTVLAAVENRGLHAEQNIVVTAQLVDEGSRTVAFSRTVQIPELPPGAVQVVKLGPQALSRPIGPQLRLIVKGIPAGSDSDTTNNQRSFLINVAP